MAGKLLRLFRFLGRNIRHGGNNRVFDASQFRDDSHAVACDISRFDFHSREITPDRCNEPVLHRIGNGRRILIIIVDNRKIRFAALLVPVINQGYIAVFLAEHLIHIRQLINIVLCRVGYPLSDLKIAYAVIHCHFIIISVKRHWMIE